MRTSISLLLFIFVFGFISCSENNGSLNTTPELINTSWTRINTDPDDVSYRAKISFSSDMLDFILLDPVEGHENSSVEIVVTDKEFKYWKMKIVDLVLNIPGLLQGTNLL